MNKARFINEFIFNQKKRKKTKKILIKMIILYKEKIIYKNKRERNFINSKIFILTKFNQLNKANKFIKINNLTNYYKDFKINFLSPKLAINLFKNLSNHKI